MKLLTFIILFLGFTMIISAIIISIDEAILQTKEQDDDGV